MWGNFIFNILFPDVLMLCFFVTESSFKESFESQFDILLFGEVFYLYTYMALVHMILPTVWLFQLLICTRSAVPGMNIQRDFFLFLSKVIYTILMIMTFMRFLVEVFYLCHFSSSPISLMSANSSGS